MKLYFGYIYCLLSLTSHIEPIENQDTYYTASHLWAGACENCGSYEINIPKGAKIQILEETRLNFKIFVKEEIIQDVEKEAYENFKKNKANISVIGSGDYDKLKIKISNFVAYIGTYYIHFFNWAYFSKYVVSKKDVYKLWVSSDDGLNLRDSPSLNAKKIGGIPFGALVEVLNDDFQEVEINGVKGKWVLILFVNQIGYVFNAYLKPDCPLKNDNDLPYKITVSRSQARKCCYGPNPSPDSGESCEGGGISSDLDYGWTPTLKEALQNLDLFRFGPVGFKPRKNCNH